MSHSIGFLGLNLQFSYYPTLVDSCISTWPLPLKLISPPVLQITMPFLPSPSG